MEGEGGGGGGRGEGDGEWRRWWESKVRKRGLHRTYYNVNLCYMHINLPRHSCNQLNNDV